MTTAPKTYYLGFTKHGQAIGRSSLRDYGYAHAAVLIHEDGAIRRRLNGSPVAVSFSRTASGAMTNLGWAGHPAEAVPVQIVDGATYRKAMKKEA